MEKLKQTELILNPEGCIYHLNLRPEHLADNIILVGDPGRVPVVSSFFDSIELRRHNREILTHTGYLNQKRISVISTGMGPDNIDIVMNELDALANIDMEQRIPHSQLKSLNIIRLGTSGAIQPDLELDRFVIAEHALGLDGLIYYYRNASKAIDLQLTDSFIEYYGHMKEYPLPYIVSGSPVLSARFSRDWYRGITATAPGFYGPQGRSIRMKLADDGLVDKLASFRHHDLRILNFEMESSAIYGLGKLMGHQCLTICPVVANRVRDAHSKDYKKVMKKLIGEVLDTLTR